MNEIKWNFEFFFCIVHSFMADYIYYIYDTLTPSKCCELLFFEYRNMLQGIKYFTIYPCPATSMP